MAFSIVADFLWWHYRFGLEEYMRAWGNMHRFFFEFFSVGLLARSFFAPFHRIQERKKPGFDPEDITETIVINILMRIVGALVRSVFIIIGLVAQLFVFMVGVLLGAIMLVFPALLLGALAVAFVLVSRTLASL